MLTEFEETAYNQVHRGCSQAALSSTSLERLCILGVSDKFHRFFLFLFFFCQFCHRLRQPLQHAAIVCEEDGSVCEVMHGRSHALASPRKSPPWINIYLSPKNGISAPWYSVFDDRFSVCQPTLQYCLPPWFCWKSLNDRPSGDAIKLNQNTKFLSWSVHVCIFSKRWYPAFYIWTKSRRV